MSKAESVDAVDTVEHVRALLGEQDYVVTVAQAEKNLVHISLAREDGEPLDPVQEQTLLTLIKGNIN